MFSVHLQPHIMRVATGRTMPSVDIRRADLVRPWPQCTPTQSGCSCVLETQRACNGSGYGTTCHLAFAESLRDPLLLLLLLAIPFRIANYWVRKTWSCSVLIEKENPKSLCFRAVLPGVVRSMRGQRIAARADDPDTKLSPSASARNLAGREDWAGPERRTGPHAPTSKAK